MPSLVRRKLTREGIRLDIPGAWPVGEREVEPAQEQSPPSLARVESAGSTEVRQVLLVSPNNKRVS